MGLIKEAVVPLKHSVSIRLLQSSSQRTSHLNGATETNGAAPLFPRGSDRLKAPRRHSDIPSNPKPSISRHCARRKRCSVAVRHHHELPMNSPDTSPFPLPMNTALSIDSLDKQSLLEGLRLARALPRLQPFQLVPKLKNLTKRKNLFRRKTVVLDLDETLVHCCEDPRGETIQVKLGDGSQVELKVLVRPFAIEVLRRLSKIFEVVVFTASTRDYADSVMNLLDPTGELIHHRLYRDDCVVVDNLHIKDLRILNRALSEMVIVDNEVTSFSYQLENGVPIASWTGCAQDVQLPALLVYLESLLELKDVRKANRAAFGLPSLT